MVLYLNMLISTTAIGLMFILNSSNTLSKSHVKIRFCTGHFLYCMELTYTTVPQCVYVLESFVFG